MFSNVEDRRIKLGFFKCGLKTCVKFVIYRVGKAFKIKFRVKIKFSSNEKLCNKNKPVLSSFFAAKSLFFSCINHSVSFERQLKKSFFSSLKCHKKFLGINIFNTFLSNFGTLYMYLSSGFSVLIHAHTLIRQKPKSSDKKSFQKMCRKQLYKKVRRQKGSITREQVNSC